MARTRIQGLTKLFKGNPPTTAADNLDLDIEEGEFLVLLGPSGCGKTTLLRIIGGFEQPTSGEVVIGGRNAELTVLQTKHQYGVPTSGTLSSS